MDNYSIAFITCVNDDELYEECIRYIDNLNVPAGYKVEKIAIRDAKSATSGYNNAMIQSNSKYKVYLHQDTFIINKDFISDCLKIFNQNEDLGMMGVIGAEIIPTNAVWWESNHKNGKVYESSTGKMGLLDFDNNKNKEEYTEVQVIDGLIMITQYDVKWREDIFDGWHFYDVSQSTEFRNAGYKIGIPMQEQPWCLHDSGVANIQNGYEQYRKTFLDIYSKDIYPLVSILIPTYNRPHYLDIALDSAVNQTYTNIEIIIGDNSDNDLSKRMLEDKYLKKYNNITYINNGGNIGMQNHFNLLNKMKGEYFNMLMDDDLFAYTKIEKMMNYYLSDPQISVVTSYRKLIDADGNFLSDAYFNAPIVKSNSRLSGKEVGKMLLMSLTNFIGEPSTVLIKADRLNSELGTRGYGVYKGKQYSPDADIAMWLQCCLSGDVIYITEPLSYFRIHSGQDQTIEIRRVIGCNELFSLLQESIKDSFFITNNDYIKSLKLWLQIANSNISSIKEIDTEEYKELIRNVKLAEDIINVE